MGTWPGAPDQPGWLATVASEEDAEEVLPRGVAPCWLFQTRRQRRLAAPVLLLAAGAAIAGIVAAHLTGSRNSPTLARSAVAADPSLSRLDPNLPAQCTHEISCVSVDAVPRRTSDAISESLTGAHERMAATVTQRGTDRLVYRVVNATSRNIELLVIVRRTPLARSAATETTDPSPGAAIRYVRRQVGHYEVQIQYTGPPGRTPPIEQAVRLSHDPRLFEVN